MANKSLLSIDWVRHPVRLTLAGVTTLLMFQSAAVHAEGVVQMGLGQRLIDHQRSIDQGYASDDASASLYVDILSVGEVINVSLCGGVQTDDITVEFYSPSNNTTPEYTQNLTEGNVNCSDPMTGPLTNPIRFTSTETGAYRLVLQNTSFTGVHDSLFDRYDITVTPDATTDPDPTLEGGRLWAYSFSFNAGGFAEFNSTDANFYARVPGGRPGTEYVWQLDLNNFAGFGYNLKANSVGIAAPRSGYSAPVIGNSAEYEHPMYVSYPATFLPRPATPPALTGVRFVDSDGQDFAISPGTSTGVQDSGVFEFTTDVEGTYSILIDLNQDGIYGNTGDRHLLGNSVIGLNQIAWDGKDAAGVAPPLGTYYSQVQMHMGEYHFIASDAETSGGTEDGLTIHLANPDGTVSPARVYWDDVTLMPAGGTSNTPVGALSNTSAGKHTWGDFVSTSFGNENLLDTYVYGLAEVFYAPTAIINDDVLQVANDGTVTADPIGATGYPIAISVTDPDLNLFASATDTVDVEVLNDVTGEIETVTLTETGSNTGIFEGTMPTAAGTTAGTANNGSMNTQPGDTLTVSYIDLIAQDLTSKIPTAAVVIELDTDGDGIPDSSDLDDDNDGIADAAEGAGDADGDGIPNSLDTDSDNDGILDATEDTNSPALLGTDSDLDGIDDAVDASITGGADENYDGVDDTLAPTDTDGDGLFDHLDMDSDADGILDSYETTINTDGDLIPNYLDLDSDGDGIPDAVEDSTTPALLGTDADADGIDDAVDVTLTGGTDANGNGIDDAFEPTDLDTDTAPNHLDLDSDGDGIPDAVEAGPNPATPIDSNSDGSPDYLDLDSDGDGILDTDEGSADTDSDGIPDFMDPDTDGDGIPDSVEGNIDTDGDGTFDYLDLDSDNDGIPDSVEAGVSSGPLVNSPQDTDADGTPDYLDIDSDDDGIADLVEAPAGTVADTDGDGIPDYQDTDSYNDNILDSAEDTMSPTLLGTDADNDGVDDAIDVDVTGGTDADGNGVDDALEPVDTDADGKPDHLDIDADNDGIADIYETILDTDSDLMPDYLDLDSDGDGIPDAIEDTTTPALLGTDADTDGIDDAIDVTQTGGTDADGNGIDDAFEPTDLDADTAPNHLELDSDGDGIPDSVEAGVNPTAPTDTDNDGTPDYLDTDSDADGIPDAIEAGPTAATPVDTDGDGSPDFLDLDADNDGTIDADEAGPNPGTPVDSDGNGVPDFIESDVMDSDNDGIPDALEGTVDSDGDGTPDYLDTDSDADGIPDSLEAGATPTAPVDTDGDGILDYLDTDSDADGLLDSQEAGANGNTPVDTDVDGIPDYQDLDADGDGLLDADEGAIDTDGDGVIDALDLDSDNDGEPDVTDGLIDSDNDGISDAVEGTLDTDGDGVVDSLDIDSDNDGLLDKDETAIDTDGDGIRDYLDLDSDNDGLTDAYEAGGTDTNTDGIIDGFVDTNNDGWDDGVAALPLPDNDFDGDGIVDHLDVDSDNDGLPDLAESNDFSADGDGDGRVDNFTDTNGDGLDDSVADFPLPADDVDNDGAPDHLDLDTDNDGISDLVEAGGIDNDGDSMVDSVLDTDGDGIPDTIDTTQTAGPDADLDGIIDAADADSNPNAQDTDGDGIIDSLDPDADGDGFADAQSDGTGSPQIDVIADNNANGIPDIDEPSTEVVADPLIRTGLSGGCSIDDSGSRDPLLPLLALVSMAYLLRRRTARIPALLSAIVIGSVILDTPSNVAMATEDSTTLSAQQAQYRVEDKLRRQIYIGFGIGSSTLTPDTDDVPGWDVSSDSDSGMQLTLGYDVNRWFSVEAHATELGDAGLSPEGSINYKTNGFSALLYAGKARHRHKRHGLTGFGRIGIGGLVNTRSSDAVPYSQENSNHLLLGVGFEYTGRRGLGVRAEFIHFDTDVKYMQLGLIYRFGKTNKRRRVAQRRIIEQEPQAVTQPLPAIVPTPTPLPTIVADRDGDRVNDNIDLCPDTSRGTAVDARGCALFNGVLEGVNFESSSAALTINARVKLNEVVATLRAYPDMRFVLSAHTDDQGSTKSNQDLSKKRVIAVAKFLQKAGIRVSRFSLKAYGELRPIADNSTAAGRAKNRRVEMKLIN